MLFIEFFKAPDGSSPVEEYLDGLDAKQAAKVLWTLSAIKLTHPSPSVYLKRMVATDDLWEVRVIFAGNIFRLLGWVEDTDKLILAHGFTKKTEKTPAREIETTETRKKIHENKEGR
jgi:phage-related protein